MLGEYLKSYNEKTSFIKTQQTIKSVYLLIASFKQSIQVFLLHRELIFHSFFLILQNKSYDTNLQTKQNKERNMCLMWKNQKYKNIITYKYFSYLHIAVACCVCPPGHCSALTTHLPVSILIKKKNPKKCSTVQPWSISASSWERTKPAIS